jgi:PAS domain S-box-containing protein
MKLENEGERRLEEVADGAPLLMWRVDKTYACEWVNRTWLEFTGRNLEQELGWGWIEGIHPEDRALIKSEYLGLVKQSEPFSFMYRLRRADGEYRSVLGHALPVIGADGALAHWVGTCTDIEDMAKANEAFRAAVQQREAAVSQRDHLFRELQHRVRNNLQLILSIIDLQARAAPESKTALELVSGRVRSIAKAQALLLDPAGAEEIDLCAYVLSVTQGVRSAPPIIFKAPAEPILLPLSRAVPLGLMLNELLALGTDDQPSRPLRVYVEQAGESVLIVFEAEAEHSAYSWPSEPSKLVQRLSVQAGAKVETPPTAPHRIVVRLRHVA